MRKPIVPVSTQQSFVVTAIFMTQKTVTAGSESQALEMAEAELVMEGAKSRNLCNWFAHRVE